MSFLKSESFKKGLALSTFLNIISKGFTFCISILIAYYFGTSIETDLYFYIIGAITAFSLFVNGSTTVAIIPELIYLKEKYGEKEAHKLINFFLYLLILVALIPALFLMISPAQSIHLISQFSITVINDHLNIFLLSSSLIILLTANTFLKEVLGCFHFFSMPMVLSIVNSISLLLCLFFLHSKLKIVSLLIGLNAGNLINLILLLTTLRRNTLWRFHYLRFKIPNHLIKRMIYAQSGSLASALSMLVPPYLLSGLGTGVIAAINFSKQIADIPSSFVTNQFSSVLGIKFNIQYARNEVIELNETFNKVFSLLIFILVPISGIIFIQSQEIIEIIFSRKAFTNVSIQEASLFCKIFVISVPLIAIDQLSARLLIAAKKIPQSFWYQVGSNIFLILTVITLLPHLKAIAFPIAILINYIVNLIVQPILFHYICPFINYFVPIKSFLKTMLLNIVILVIISLLNKIGFFMSLNCYISVVMNSIIYLSLLIFFNIAFKINDEFLFYTNLFLTSKLSPIESRNGASFSNKNR